VLAAASCRGTSSPCQAALAAVATASTPRPGWGGQHVRAVPTSLPPSQPGATPPTRLKLEGGDEREFHSVEQRAGRGGKIGRTRPCRRRDSFPCRDRDLLCHLPLLLTSLELRQVAERPGQQSGAARLETVWLETVQCLAVVGGLHRLRGPPPLPRVPDYASGIVFVLDCARYCNVEQYWIFERPRAVGGDGANLVLYGCGHGAVEEGVPRARGRVGGGVPRAQAGPQRGRSGPQRGRSGAAGHSNRTNKTLPHRPRQRPLGARHSNT
jgi:hypothetical protein